MDTVILNDIKTYFNAMSQNNVTLCLSIERKYGLEGYPPNIVTPALQAKAEGLDMAKFLDDMMGI